MKSVLNYTHEISDFFFDSNPFSDDAAKVFSRCESREIKGFITSVIISNVFYLLRPICNHEKVIEKITQLSTITEVLRTNKDVIQRALNSNFKEFEDTLQNYSAESNGQIDLIMTRNNKDFKNSYPGVMTLGII